MIKLANKRVVDYWLTKDGLLLIEGWARDGLTYEQIAKQKLKIHILKRIGNSYLTLEDNCDILFGEMISLSKITLEKTIK